MSRPLESIVYGGRQEREAAAVHSFWVVAPRENFTAYVIDKELDRMRGQWNVIEATVTRKRPVPVEGQ